MALKISAKELDQLVEGVLLRLAKDPDAAHLFHWEPRPGCADEPAGKQRRNHLKAMLALLGAAALPGTLAACDDKLPAPADGATPDGAICGDDPCASTDGSIKRDAPPCGDDPCGCADDPCACADDPCAVADGGPTGDGLGRRDGQACADDPCACADDPCSATDGGFRFDGLLKRDGGFCADDPCACADDPCGGGGN